jgi:hypothetical protein
MIDSLEDEDGLDYDYLLCMPVSRLTKERRGELSEKISEKIKEIGKALEKMKKREDRIKEKEEHEAAMRKVKGGGGGDI